jgi:adenylosuccinate lyase
MACGREFSKREGTLLARSKLPEDTVVRLLKCQRWGVCDAGTAAMCAVDLKTVHRFQQVPAQRVKAIEATIGHDVKAVGYYLKERCQGTTLEDMREWVHF